MKKLCKKCVLHECEYCEALMSWIDRKCFKKDNANRNLETVKRNNMGRNLETFVEIKQSKRM